MTDSKDRIIAAQEAEIKRLKSATSRRDTMEAINAVDRFMAKVLEAKRQMEWEITKGSGK